MKLFYWLNTSILLMLVMGLCSCSTNRWERLYPKNDYQYVMNREGKAQPYIPGTEGQKEVKVQVLDASTMQPIAGAIVVGGYYAAGRSGDSGNVSCARSESAVSDAEGWATLPNDQDERIKHLPGGNWMYGPQLKSAYKRGYKVLSLPFKAPDYGVENEKEYWYLAQLVLDEGLWNYKSSRIRLPERYPDEKTAILAGHTRSTIYLMPSTATTKEERLEELNRMGYSGGPCFFSLPFAFSRSEGGLAAMRAVYQEMLDGDYPENAMRYQRFLVETYEDSQQKFRSGAYGNWGKP